MTPERFKELREYAKAARRAGTATYDLGVALDEALDALDMEDRRANAAIRALKAALEPL
jgi:hypothetical protein